MKGEVGKILIRLDGWLFPDTADQRQAMARAAAALARAEEVAAVDLRHRRMRYRRHRPRRRVVARAFADALREAAALAR